MSTFRRIDIKSDFLPTIHIRIGLEEKVQSLVSEYRELRGIGKDRILRLEYEGKILDENENLSTYDVKKGAKMHCYVLMTISLEMNGNVIMEMCMKEWNTVLSLKNIVQMRFGYPVDRQVIWIGEERLASKDPFYFLSISNGSYSLKLRLTLE